MAASVHLKSSRKFFLIRLITPWGRWGGGQIYGNSGPSASCDLARDSLHFSPLFMNFLLSDSTETPQLSASLSVHLPSLLLVCFPDDEHANLKITAASTTVLQPSVTLESPEALLGPLVC